MRALTLLLALGALSGCYRETADYDVRLYGQGTRLDEVMPEAEEMGGLIEMTRVRLWGVNLGMAMFGGADSPRSDGLEFVYPYAAFGYPVNQSWARGGVAFPSGPDIADEPACVTLIDVDYSPGPFSEYVDVGDHLALSADDGSVLRLDRDPAVHPRPAGESWFAGYGTRPIPYVPVGNENLAPTWRPNDAVTVSFPGTVQAPESTMGAIPFPGEGELTFPPELSGVRINGDEVRAPRHGYDEEGVWVGDLFQDNVRFDGPWNEGGTTIEWDTVASAGAVTISVRYLYSGVENPCTACSECELGFTCEPEDPDDPGSDSYCTADEGSSWLVAGDVTCTVPDDGIFTMTSEHLEMLDLYLPPYLVDGAIMTVSRRLEDTMTVPDAMSFNGKRVPINPIRTRATDLIVTRLDTPPPLPGQDEDGEALE